MESSRLRFKLSNSFEFRSQILQHVEMLLRQVLERYHTRRLVKRPECGFISSDITQRPEIPFCHSAMTRNVVKPQISLAETYGLDCKYINRKGLV
jgi:hypothetical protein